MDLTIKLAQALRARFGDAAIPLPVLAGMDRWLRVPDGFPDSLSLSLTHTHTYVYTHIYIYI